jgi:O-acetyl-ADP-ribose deacetylase
MRALRLTAYQGDITTVRVDAIVNAANEALLGGGGVDGAIHRAAGPGLLEACRAIPEVRPGVRCPVGEARITPGFDLSARHVIHTVGPVYRGRLEDAELLGSAYRSSLTLAEQHQVGSIAFPAISCGVFSYPLSEAAEVAVSVAREKSWSLAELHFVLFSEDVLEAWRGALRSST